MSLLGKAVACSVFLTDLWLLGITSTRKKIKWLNLTETSFNHTSRVDIETFRSVTCSFRTACESSTPLMLFYNVSARFYLVKPVKNRTTAIYDSQAHNSRRKMTLLTEVHLALKRYSVLKRGRWHCHIGKGNGTLKRPKQTWVEVIRKLVTGYWLGLEQDSCLVQTLSATQRDRHNTGRTLGL